MIEISALLTYGGMLAAGLAGGIAVSWLRNQQEPLPPNEFRQEALARLIDRIMPSVWFVYALWFAGNCVVTFNADPEATDTVVGLWAAFGGSVATFALTLAKNRVGDDE